MGSGNPLLQSSTAAPQDRKPREVLTQSEPDIQWFKDQMKISDKYREVHEGIFGVSWIHFFIMVFLVLFAMGALASFMLKQKKINEILKRIQKEMEDAG